MCSVVEHVKPPLMPPEPPDPPVLSNDIGGDVDAPLLDSSVVSGDINIDTVEPSVVSDVIGVDAGAMPLEPPDPPVLPNGIGDDAGAPLLKPSVVAGDINIDAVEPSVVSDSTGVDASTSLLEPSLRVGDIARRLQPVIWKGFVVRRELFTSHLVGGEVVGIAAVVATDVFGQPRQEAGFARDARWAIQAGQTQRTSFFLGGRVFAPATASPGGVRARLLLSDELRLGAVLSNSAQDEALRSCTACFDSGAGRSLISKGFAAALCGGRSALAVSDGNKWLLSSYRGETVSDHSDLGIVAVAYFLARREAPSSFVGAFVFSFVITPGLFVDLLLGNDALSDLRAVIDTFGGSVSICSSAACRGPAPASAERIQVATAPNPSAVFIASSAVISRRDIEMQEEELRVVLPLEEEEDVYDEYFDESVNWRAVFGIDRSGFELQRDLAILNACPDIGVEGRRALFALISEFAEQFALGKMSAEQPAGGCVVESELFLRADAVPVYQLPRRIPFRRLAQMEDECLSQRAAGVISPLLEPSEWRACSFLVPKPHPPPDAPKELRYVTDFAAASKQLIRTGFDLTHTGDCKQVFFGARYFNEADALASFWQVRYKPSSRRITAHHTTPALGPHVYNVMGMGFASSSGELQRIITLGIASLEAERRDRFEVEFGPGAREVIQRASSFPRDLELDEAAPYFSLPAYLRQMVDDIKFGSFSWERSVELWRYLLEVAKRLGLVFRLSKCGFLLNQITSMGMSISASGIASSISRIQPILDFPIPTNRTTLARVIGMFGFYSAQIPNYAELLIPFRPMRVGPQLSPKQFRATWDVDGNAGASFDALKKAITSAPILGFLRPGGLLVLFTDSSKVAMGAVLLQFPPHPEGALGLAAALRSWRGDEY